MSDASVGTGGISIPAARSRAWRLPPLVWPAVVAMVAFLPFLPGLQGDRIFFIRDLSQFFWGRHLWLRSTIWSGEWPLWDPYLGGGQSAVADALHQMFLLPVLAVRLLGGDVVGFNLWVALPFPVAAASAYAFFSRRFGRPAAALGALAFALAGPVASTGNMPNLSWAVAALPLVLWAADRLAESPSARGVALLAGVVAFQALAGEPVTLFATATIAVPLALVLSSPIGSPWRDRGARGAYVVAGIALGGLLAALQLMPTAEAAMLAERWKSGGRDMWSLHPLMLIELVVPHLFGDYFSSRFLAVVPWMRALNTGMEPLLFSLYIGMPLVVLSWLGLLAGPRRWTIFWGVCGVVGLLGALGTNTPLYSVIRDQLPGVNTFRFPVKYLVMLMMAIAACVAAGWDALSTQREAPTAAFRRARMTTVTVAVVIGIVSYAVVIACMFFTTGTAFQLYALAKALGLDRPVDGVEFMLKTLPRAGTILMLLSLAAAALIAIGSSRRREASAARLVLYVLVVGDLVVHTWSTNPAFDAAYMKGAEWFGEMSDRNARFYIGGKVNGRIEHDDPDAPRALYGPAGFNASQSRAAIHGQTPSYPSGWGRREMLSADMAHLWPATFQRANDLFTMSERAARERFLDRTGVRYRILPRRRADFHAPLIKVRYLDDTYLYDWGAVTPRAGVVTTATVVPETSEAIDRLFTPGWDSRTSAVLDRPLTAAGAERPPEDASASIVVDRFNRVVIEAGVPAGGGYLVLLDSYAADWRVTVDGAPAELGRANGLFRGVRLRPGRHVVEFAYRPRAFMRGAAVSAIALLIVGVLATRRTTRPGPTELSRA